MHISLLTDGIYPYVLGGMQMHSYYLAKYFAKNKIHVRLYHPVMDIKNDQFLNCFTEEEKIYMDLVFIEAPKSVYFPGHYIYESYNYSKNICLQYFQQGKTDFIYAQGFTGWELIKQKKKGNSSIVPIGVNFHGLNMFQPAFGLRNILNNLLFRPAVKFNLKYADCVFSLGKKLSKLISENVRNVKDIIEIPVGIDDMWPIEEGEIRNQDVLTFVFVGRYDKVKGIDLLNNAIQNLLNENRSFKFDFIGPIPENARLNDRNVKYHGEIRNTLNLKEILKKSDVIINASYSEGMPTVIIEGMACGLAVIATDVGAVGELTDRQNGILIPPGNLQSIEESMLEFIQMDKKQLYEMKKNSLSRVKTFFLWDRIISKTIREIKMKIH